MKICNRCKVKKALEDFKTEKSKSCIKCREVAKNAYELKKQGKLPKYAETQKELEMAYNRGNFICKICKEEKPLSNFGKHINNNKYNISRVCKTCSIQLNKESKIRGYNLSKDEFVKKLKEQNYQCKICKSEIKYLSPNKEKYKSACIDHDHKTGKIRGLLCSNCNRALGLFKDDQSIIKNAYKYLVQYKSGELLENPE
jgi:hypothetical protein